MDTCLWWSGIAAWIFFGAIGLLWFIEAISEWAINVFWSRKEFLSFVWDRQKAKRHSNV